MFSQKLLILTQFASLRGLPIFWGLNIHPVNIYLSLKTPNIISLSWKIISLSNTILSGVVRKKIKSLRFLPGNNQIPQIISVDLNTLVLIPWGWLSFDETELRETEVDSWRPCFALLRAIQKILLVLLHMHFWILYSCPNWIKPFRKKKKKNLLFKIRVPAEIGNDYYSPS